MPDKFKLSSRRTKYLLRDDFTMVKAAGSVNNSQAVPYGGKRTAVDTGSKITVTANGLLNFATGETANDGVWWPIQKRYPGKTALIKVTPSNTTGVPAFGWDTNQTGAINDALQLNASANIMVVPNGGTAILVGVYTAVAYKIAAVLRGTGVLWFIKGGAFTTWTLLYITAAGTAAVYPGIQSQNTVGIFTADLARVIQRLTISPISSDTFNRANGNLGNTDGAVTEEPGGSGKAWTANVGTWGIATNVAACSALAGGFGAATFEGGTPNVVLEAAATRTGGNVGILARYQDSTNYLIAYHDGTNARLDKVVAGTPTNLLTAVATYGAGNIIRIALDGTNARLWYNNVAIGTVGVTPAATYTAHGIYTTNISNTIDNVVCWARGNEGQYGFFDKYIV